jgi:hypothetical protein
VLDVLAFFAAIGGVALLGAAVIALFGWDKRSGRG